MMKEKKIWIVVFVVLTFIAILTGCTDLPKMAEISIVADPNPVPYSTGDENWQYLMSISESNGVGVTVTSFTFTDYNQEDESVATAILDAEQFSGWFGTGYIPAFSTIQSESEHSGTAVYTIVIVAGIDNNDNLVEATLRIDYLPE